MITTAKLPTKGKSIVEALELYDNFTYAANELAVATIQKDTPDSRILEPFVSKSAPAELLSIRLLPCCTGKYTKADSVLTLVPEEAVSEDLRPLFRHWPVIIVMLSKGGGYQPFSMRW